MNCPVCGKELTGKQKTYCSRECRLAGLRARAETGIPAEGRHKPRQRADTKLARLRAERGITQAQLAKEAGVSNATLSGMEQGHVEGSVSVLKRLADVLGVDWRELVE